MCCECECVRVSASVYECVCVCVRKDACIQLLRREMKTISVMG